MIQNIKMILFFFDEKTDFFLSIRYPFLFSFLLKKLKGLTKYI